MSEQVPSERVRSERVPSEQVPGKPARKWDVATVGEIYIDHVFAGLPDWPRPGEEVFTRNYVKELGGGAAITACSLALLGRRTAVFGVIGNGEKDWIEQRLRSFGVSADNLESVDAASGITVSVSVTHERSFYSHRGANEQLTDYMQAGQLAAALQLASHIHFAAPLERVAAAELLPLLKQAGCSTSIDAGWQPDWYTQPDNLKTCMEVDYFLPNEKEAQLITGITADDHPEQLLRSIERMGLGNAVIKLGPRGAIAWMGEGAVSAASLPIEVVDTTGAGDAFDAGLIDAILDHKNMQEILRRASACGSLSTRCAGALRGLPTREELNAYE